MIRFIKIQSENMKMTWNISLFIFCMIYSFSKCDGFTIVLWIISWRSNSMVLSSLFLLSNRGNLTLKLHQKNSYLNEGWLFIGRFKVGSLPRMESIADASERCSLWRIMNKHDCWNVYRFSCYIFKLKLLIKHQRRKVWIS